MLKAVPKTFSLKLGSRLFVCLRNKELPPELRQRVRPIVLGMMACWMDRLPADHPPS